MEEQFCNNFPFPIPSDQIPSVRFAVTSTHLKSPVPRTRFLKASCRVWKSGETVQNALNVPESKGTVLQEMRSLIKIELGM